LFAALRIASLARRCHVVMASVYGRGHNSTTEAGAGTHRVFLNCAKGRPAWLKELRAKDVAAKEAFVKEFYVCRCGCTCNCECGCDWPTTVPRQRLCPPANSLSPPATAVAR
jgi:hypothetical protein